MGLSTGKKTPARRTHYSAPALEKGLDVLEALADFAKARGDDEVATILWSVAAWSGE